MQPRTKTYGPLVVQAQLDKFRMFAETVEPAQVARVPVGFLSMQNKVSLKTHLFLRGVDKSWAPRPCGRFVKTAGGPTVHSQRSQFLSTAARPPSKQRSAPKASRVA